MADKRRIMISTGSRSEHPLLDPILRRIEKHPDLSYLKFHADPARSLHEICRGANETISREEPSIIFIPFDRREQVPVAMTGFYSNTPVIHFGGGVYTDSATHDDVGRHVISMFSHLVLVESEAARDILIRAGEEGWRVKVCGSTHLDDLDVDESMCPSEAYDLFLMNPSTISKERTLEDVKAGLKLLGERAVLIGPNEDAFSTDIVMTLYEWMPTHRKHSLYATGLPRPKFLGLLRNCRRFVSNSSSTIYEAPYFRVMVDNPSMRNSVRTAPSANHLSGGADAAVKILAETELNEELLRKKVRTPEWAKFIQPQ